MRAGRHSATGARPTSPASPFPVPNVVNRARFANAPAFDGFTNNGLGPPTSNVIDNAHSYNPLTGADVAGFAAKRAYQVTVWNVTNVAAGSPAVVTAPGHGLTNGGATLSGTTSTPNVNGFQTVTVIDANTFSVPIVVTIGGASGGTVGQDKGSELDWVFYRAEKLSLTADRIWHSFAFYYDAVMDGGIKFTRYFDTGFATQFGGLGLGNVPGGTDGVAFGFLPEGGGGTAILKRSRASMLGIWQYVELDYWRNGDPSGFPSVAFWWSTGGGPQVNITTQIGALPVGWSWTIGPDGESRLNPGARASAALFGVTENNGLINGVPGNTVPFGLWVDYVSVSTRGRIGL